MWTVGVVSLEYLSTSPSNLIGDVFATMALLKW